jgi:polar amino acid transport system substrate-binding protein
MKCFRKREIIALVFVASLGFVLCGPESAHAGKRTISIGGVFYPPFFFEDGSGAATDMLNEALGKIGYSANIMLFPLARAIVMVNSGNIQAAFLFPQTDPQTTVKIPIYYAAHIFLFKKSRFPRGLHYNKLSDLKDYIIGAHIGSGYSKRILQEGAGLQLDYAPDIEMNLKKLAAQRIDLFAIFDITAHALLVSIFPDRTEEFGFSKPFVLTPLCLIFSKKYPGNDAIADDVQRKLAYVDMQAIIQKHFG